MVSYQTFIQEVKESFLDYLPNKYQECKVEITVNYKNNTKRDGILVLGKDETMAPVLYLDDFYKEMYERELPMDMVMKKMAEVYQQALAKKEDMPMPQYRNPQVVLKNLYTQAINFEKNQEFLKTVPYLQINDLAIIPRSKIGENYSMVVTDDLCSDLGFDGDTILAKAINNNIEVTKPSLNVMGDILTQLLENSPEVNQEMLDAIQNEPLPMYVLTNQDKYHGASLIANKQLLDAIGKAMGQDYYILPSSVHELLILPQSEAPNVKYLKEMVMEVNRTELAPEEFLSDNVYFYDGKSREVQMYSGTMEREKVQHREESKRRPQR